MMLAQTDFHVSSAFDCGQIYDAGRRKPSASKSSRRKKETEPAVKGDHGAVPGKNRVLLLGRFQELGLYRAEVLRSRGFEVQFCSRREEALQLVRNADFDAVVLSYTLPSEVVEELAEETRESSPHSRLIVIASSDRVDRKISPDAIAIAEDGPPSLLSALQRVLQ